MPSIQEISFYHECGHTGNYIWAEEMPDNDTRLGLPELDCVKLVGPVNDDKITEDVVEIFYQNTACGACNNSTIKTLPKLDRKAIEERRERWSVLSTSFDHYLQKFERNEQAEAATLTALETEPVGVAGSDVGVRDDLTEQAFLLENKIKEARAKQERWARIQSYFKLVIKTRKVDEDDNITNKDQVHFYSPGWDTQLLALVRKDSNKVTTDDEPICAICILDLFSERARKLPCGHIFHHDCIREWMNEEDTCPMCRAEYKITRGPKSWTDDGAELTAWEDLEYMVNFTTSQSDVRHGASVHDPHEHEYVIPEALVRRHLYGHAASVDPLSVMIHDSMVMLMAGGRAGHAVSEGGDATDNGSEESEENDVDSIDVSDDRYEMEDDDEFDDFRPLSQQWYR